MIVDVDAAPAPAFALAEELPAGPGGWHAHQRHQILYARAGTLSLEADDATWLLPPQRAAWIPVGVSHRVEVRRTVSLRTTYLRADLVAAPPAGCRVFGVSTLLAEMLVEATRWGPAREPDPVADAFFAALGGLCAERARASLAFRLPRARSPEVGMAMRFTRERLAEPISLPDAARAAGVSERTLRRRFREEVGLGWGEYLQAARMIAASEALSQEGASVTDTAREVGYRSLAAFSDAFLAFTGERPARWVQRAPR